MSARGLVFVLLQIPSLLGAQATLKGHVRSADGERPLPGVDVIVPALNRQVVTQADGAFFLTDLPAGSIRLVIRGIGYKVLDVTQAIPPSGALTVVFLLTASPVVLDSLVVTEQFERHRRRMAEFERRRRMGIGSFLTRAQLAERENINLGSLLREFGIVDGRPPARGRSGSFSQGCRTMQLVVDNIRYPYSNIRDYSIRHIEAIEIYTGTARVPLQFEWGNASCGVVVLWTKTG